MTNKDTATPEVSELNAVKEELHSEQLDNTYLRGKLDRAETTKVWLAVGIYLGYALGFCLGAAAVRSRQNNSVIPTGGKLMYVVDVNS